MRGIKRSYKAKGMYQLQVSVIFDQQYFTDIYGADEFEPEANDAGYDTFSDWRNSPDKASAKDYLTREANGFFSNQIASIVGAYLRDNKELTVTKTKTTAVQIMGNSSIIFRVNAEFDYSGLEVFPDQYEIAKVFPTDGLIAYRVVDLNEN